MRKPQYPKSSLFTFRLWDDLRDELPEDKRAEFINQAIKEKLDTFRKMADNERIGDADRRNV